jgi:hypothetical protein
MSKREPGQKPAKIKHDKFYTRARSERELSGGADPAQTFKNDKGMLQGRFTDHPNYHVRRKAWMKMGQPLPEDAGERAKFLAGLKIKEKAPEAEPAPAAES